MALYLTQDKDYHLSCSEMKRKCSGRQGIVETGTDKFHCLIFTTNLQICGSGLPGQENHLMQKVKPSQIHHVPGKFIARLTD
jgi:hypothetical protein